MTSEPACACCNEVSEFPVTESAYGGSYRAVINKSSMIPDAPFYMAIKAIIAGIEDTPFKPPVERTAGVFKNLIPSFFPGYLLCSIPPECLRIFN
jgi:hypothetical protein